MKTDQRPGEQQWTYFAVPVNLQSLRGIGATLLWIKVTFDLVTHLTAAGADNASAADSHPVMVLVFMLVALTAYLHTLRRRGPTGPPAVEAIP